MQPGALRTTFRLALALGRTVDELLGSITEREYQMWLAFYGVEPFGDEAEDVRWSSFMAMFANANRGKNSPAERPRKYSLIKLRPAPQTPEQQKAAFKALRGG